MIWSLILIAYLVIAAARLMIKAPANFDLVGAFGWPVLTAAWLIRMAFFLAVAIIASFLHGVVELVDRTIAIFAKGPQ